MVDANVWYYVKEIKLDEEQAINYIGKTVYVVDYVSYEIVPRKVKSLLETDIPYTVDLLDTDNNIIEVEYFYTWLEAKEFLIDYCEKKVDLGMQILNDVLALEEDNLEGTW